jgi:hypothetical protein
MEVRISYEIVLGPGAYLVGGNFRAALRAEENNLISLFDISYIGNIDHSQSMHTLPTAGAR